MAPDPWTFSMVTPDAMVGGHLDFILTRVASFGFRVRACRLLRLDYERLGRMYSHSDRPIGYSGQRTELPPWLMTPLYAIAPAAVLVLARDAGNACATMLRAKGPARPEAALPDTIRAAGENYVHNLVHCPDDAASAAIELAYLLGPTDAAALQALATADAPALAPLVGVEQLRLGLPAYAGWEALSFPMVASRLRHRVVQQLAPHALHDDDRRAALQSAHEALRRERDTLAAASSVRERLAVAQAMSPQIHALLLTAATSPADAALAAGLVALAELYDVHGARDPAPLRALASAGVYLSELETIVLETQAYTFWS